MLTYQKHPYFLTAVCSVWDKGYRYGFNGKEIDKGDEGMGGGGSTYDYGFRIYNPSIGKFLSVDPLTASYPWYTPYQFAGNMPIWAIDLDGLEEKYVTFKGVTVRPKLDTKWADQVLDDIVKQMNQRKYGRPVKPSFFLTRFFITAYLLLDPTNLGEGSDGHKYVDGYDVGPFGKYHKIWKSAPQSTIKNHTWKEYQESRVDVIKRVTNNPRNYSDRELNAMRERILQGKGELNDWVALEIWYEKKGINGKEAIRSIERVNKFSDNWESASFKDIIGKHTNGVTPNLSDDGIKLKYQNENYDIQYDRVGNYFRIFDKTKNDFVDLEGNVPTKKEGESSKQFKDRKQTETHFKNSD